MPSARELRMRQLLEEKKKAILAEQAQAQKAKETETPQPKEQDQKPSSEPTSATINSQEPSPSSDTTEPQHQPPSSQEGEQNPQAQPKSRSRFFQAVGTVSGLIRQNDDGKFAIQIEGREYFIYVPKRFQPALTTHIADQPDTPIFARVYPQCRYEQGEPKFFWIMIRWSNRNKWKAPVNLLTLRGIWQVSPKFETTTIAIYRNPRSIDPTKRFKAYYLPVEMEREDQIQPFCYNPELPKEEQPQRFFIQGYFRINQEGSALIWVEDIAPPTTELPRYKKPRKFKKQKTNPPPDNSSSQIQVD